MGVNKAMRKYKWKGQSPLPAGMPVTIGLERLSERIYEASRGRFIWEVAPAGSITPATKEWLGVHEDKMEFCAGGGGYMLPEVAFGGVLVQPLAIMPPEHLEIWFDIEGSDIANRLYMELGYDILDIKCGGFPGPPEIFAHSNIPLNTLNDLVGLRMRAVGDGANVLSRLGVETVFLSMGKIKEEMEAGRIDAFECSSASFNWAMGLTVGTHIYLSPVRGSTEHFQLLVNRSKFEALPIGLKYIIEDCARSEAMRYHSSLVSGDAEALQNFRDYGNIVQKLPPEIEKEFVKQAKLYIDEEMAKDPGYKEVVESQRAFAKSFDELYGLPDWVKPEG